MNMRTMKMLCLISALAASAAAIDTPKVNLGRYGDYDGTMRIERDASGRMIFRDAQVPAGSALYELLTGAQPRGTLRVAAQGGDFTTLTAAYDAVTTGGLILVYPGEYTLGERLTLGPKGCSFVGFDAALTTVTTPSGAANIVIGSAAAPAGGEDWDAETPYTMTGRFSFTGLTFKSGTTPALTISRANMSRGGLALRSCRFAAKLGVKTLTGAEVGYSTNLDLAIADCEFLAVDNTTEETAIQLANRARGGPGRGSARIERCTFNPARLAPGSAAPPTYSYGVSVRGSGERVLLRDNLFLDVMFPFWLNGGADHTIDIEGNVVDFDSSSAGIDAAYVVGFAFGGTGGGQAIRLSGNRVRLRDSNASPSAVFGIYTLFTSGTGNAITSRANDYNVPSAAYAASFAEEPGGASYTLDSCEDLWSSKSISTGTFTVTAGGDRRMGAARADGLRIDGNAALGSASAASGATNTLVIGDGTAPASSPAGAVQLFADMVSGSAELRVRDEAGNVTTLSPHTFKLFAPPKDCPLPWSYYSRNEAVGKEINVDMAGLVLAVERLTGKRFMYLRNLEAGSK